MFVFLFFLFFFKQKTAYEMRISDWSSDVCSSDLLTHPRPSAHRSGKPTSGQPPLKRALLTRSWSVESIMASGHEHGCSNRPDAWQPRPAVRDPIFPCQRGAVHTMALRGPIDPADMTPAMATKPEEAGSSRHNFCVMIPFGFPEPNR